MLQVHCDTPHPDSQMHKAEIYPVKVYLLSMR